MLAQPVNDIILSLRDQMIEDFRAWIRIPSVKEAPLPNAPFGAGVRAMLDRALADMKKLGFAPVDFDGYAAHADLGEGSDEDALAILAHLDVVPAGDGWQVDPFGAQVIDGRLYGRGTTDDKGPALAALYAMYAVKQSGVRLKRKVRLILGCDEESGWADIDYYTRHAVMPRMGFSPDACYPVINVEKGMLHLSLNASAAGEGLRVLAFDAGERVNVICGRASALVAGDAALAARAEAFGKAMGFPVAARATDEGVRIETEGIPGHSAYPDQARSAIGQMLLILRELGAQGALRTLADAVGVEHDGASLGIQVRDALSGPLTCNMGVIRVNGERVYATLDLRVPVMADFERLLESIRAHLPGVEVTVDSQKAPHHVSETSELVRGLLAAYTEMTGLPGKALSTGGGTYGRALAQGVAFGCQFPDEEDLAHQAGEHVRLDRFVENVRIMACAILKLAGA